MKKRLLKKINFKFIIIIFIIIIFSCWFILYNTPVEDLIITSSYSTMNHKYIADILYSEKTINYVLDKNTVLESDEVSNPDFINISNKKDGYRLIKIKGKTYNGYLVLIYNPSFVKLSISKDLGVKGELITSVVKREKAKIAINGGGFFDPNWNSNGALAHGVVIKDGKVVNDYVDSSVGGGYIGFTNDDKLVLGKMSKSKALKTYRDAIEFGPFLIINGKKTKIKGNGGFGIAPRTVIGQRRDGVVLFLVINGRIPTSIGADMNDLYDIMSKYGAYNAANLDGGSSSELIINNKIINTPVAGGKNGLRPMPTFWIVKS